MTKLTLPVEHFRRAASIVAKLAKQSAPHPFNSVLIKSDGGTVTMTTTDGTVHASARVDSVGRGPSFAASISAKKLVGLVGAWDGDEVQVEADKRIVTIRAANHWTELPACEEADFHACPKPAESVRGKRAELLAAIRVCLPHVATDNTRYVLSGVLADGNKFVATDGRRLVVAKCGNVGLGIIPSEGLAIVAAMLADSENAEAHFGSTDKAFAAKCDGRTVWGQNIEGAFPAYDKILNSATTTVTATVSRERLLDSIRRARLVIDSGAIAASKGGLTIGGSKPESGTCEETVEATIDGKAAPINVNLAYINDAIANVDDEAVTIEWGDPLAPMRVVTSVATIIIMPMRAS